MKKHICFVTKFYGIPKNGPGTFAHNFIRKLANDNEYELTVISGERHDSLHGENIVSYSPNNHVIDGIKIRNLIREIHKNKKIDIIYFNCYRNAIFSYSLKIPYVLNVNDHHRFIGDKLNIWKIVAPKIIGNANVTFFNSDFTKSIVSNKITSLNSNKTAVTYKGINLKDFVFNFSPIQGDQIQLLFVGSNFYRKGLDTVIKALSSLKKNTNINFNLKVIGEDNSLKEKVNSMVQKHNLFNDIEFLGKQDKTQIIEHQKNAQILLLPSREEAFGVVLLEALASGTSVIASNVGGIPKIISNRENGILIEKEDSVDLYKSLLYLVENNEKRVAMANTGAQMVKRFNFDSIYKKIMSYIKDL